MSRRYHDLIEVRLGDPVEHRVRLDPGWRRGVPTTEVEVEVPTQFLWHGRLHVVRGVLAQWSQRLPWWRRSDEDGGSALLEQEVWRVEAAAGRAGGSGVYDLVRREHWLLERVSD